MKKVLAVIFSIILFFSFLPFTIMSFVKNAIVWAWDLGEDFFDEFVDFLDDNLPGKQD